MVRMRPLLFGLGGFCHAAEQKCSPSLILKLLLDTGHCYLTRLYARPTKLNLDICIEGYNKIQICKHFDIKYE